MKTPLTSIRDTIAPIFIACIAMTIWTFYSHGLSLIVTFDLGMLIALFMYFTFTHKSEGSYSSVVPIYFLALAVQFLHFAEEFVTGFHIRWPVEIFRATPYDTNMFLLVNMISYFFFTLAGIAMFKKIKFPIIIAWFFIVMGVCIQAVQHTVYAMMVGGYFPGLYTSLLCYLLGPMLIIKMIKASR
ncbi:MAG: HXXEE domain-containing protein [Candidatus Peribacteria bacterium]|nr:HXXEE domain-containing protein [Candidatus Peribacteria bacterium]